MEGQEEDVASAGFQPLFIREAVGGSEDGRDADKTLTRLTFTETELKQSALMRPYLQEMDILLKSCEELTGIPLGSYKSQYCNETESSCGGGEEVASLTRSLPAYRPTSSIETNTDGADTQTESHRGTTLNKHRTYGQRAMPLSLDGNKLSDSMVKYENQLSEMLALLEKCMEEDGKDVETPGRILDAHLELTHISKNTQPFRAPTPTALQTLKMDVPSKTCVRRQDTLKESNLETPLRNCEQMCCFSAEKCGPVAVQDELFQPLEQDPVLCEMKTEDVPSTDVDDSDVAVQEFRTDLESDLHKLRFQVEDCVANVQKLEKQRRELLAEVMALRRHEENAEVESQSEADKAAGEQMESKVVQLLQVVKREEKEKRENTMRVIHSLREERAEEQGKIWRLNVEIHGMQEELSRLKRKLFVAARDCAQSQAALKNQQHVVKKQRTEEETLTSMILELTGEMCQVRSEQHQQILNLQKDLQEAQSSHQTLSTHEELTEKRQSCRDIQQHLQSSLKALEDRYGPVLVALLKRRETTAGAVQKAKEEAQELKEQLKPLREEIQKRRLEKACLEEKLKLTDVQRQEDASHYKETVHVLRETSRKLKTELEIQRRKCNEMKEMSENLSKQLKLQRASAEGNDKCEEENKT